MSAGSEPSDTSERDAGLRDDVPDVGAVDVGVEADWTSRPFANPTTEIADPTRVTFRPAGDADADGIDDRADNCPEVPNAEQMDRDADRVGDRCDVCPLIPGDGGLGATGTAFVDVSECVGFDPVHVLASENYYGIGQAFGDYDRDGWLDLYVTNTSGPNRLFHNEGDGTFVDSPLADAVALPDAESGGATFADYDNDGFLDLYVVNRGANVLFHNEDGRAFVDVTDVAGVGAAAQNESASWGDYDGDGFLDLYVTNWLCHFCPELAGEYSRDHLYHNEGDGTFRDVTALLDPGTTTGAGFVAGFLDYDSDGDLDIYVVNDKGTAGPLVPMRTNRNVLFRNDGAGCGGWCFTEVAVETGSDVRGNGMGLAVGDYDADGDLDMVVTLTAPPALLRNELPIARFSDVAPSSGLGPDDVDWRYESFGFTFFHDTWGTVFFDYDRDGWLDLYIAVSGHDGLFGGTSVGRFEDRTATSGASEPHDTLGAAYGDYDRDGRVDLVIGNRGWDYRLLRNVTPMEDHHGITVRLEGGGSVNRDAVGARVYVDTSDGRTQMCEVINGSSLGAGNDLACSFGLGTATIARVRVRWPDGSLSSIDAPSVDAELTIRYAAP